MKYFLFLLSLGLFISCGSLNKGDKTGTMAEAPVMPPSGLEGPAYDPSTSPVPMGANTPLPVPNQPVEAGTTQQPSAYGSVPADPTQSVPLDPAMEAKGEATNTAPQTYDAPATAPPTYAGNNQAPQTYGTQAAPQTYAAPAPNTAEYALAQVLNGMWINSTDEREIVEFTPDHYRTFYEGEMLIEEDMTYHTNCPGDCNDGTPMEIACFTISGPAGTDCYGIVRLTPEVLELSMLGVSTETILYTKQR